MVGSTLFALGSLPFYAAQVDARAIGVTFFVGSILFTSAGYIQFFQTINDSGEPRARRRFLAVRRRDLVWWAAAVQLAGTILFNFSTGHAMITDLDTDDVNRMVWRPDMFGSVAFLVASHCAWLAVYGRHWVVRRDDAEWWTTALNYLGSMFFMASAIASLTLPTTGDVVSIAIVNAGTLCGAVCFLLGAYVMLPAAPDAARVTSA
jgi:hypothetical protein